MDQKIIDFNKSQKTKQIPEIQTGDVIAVHKKIKEGDKERVQIFKGLVIAIKGKQSSSPTITVRKDSQGIGVEITIPVYSPSIEKIEIVRHSKIRRSKLYYMRERTGKAAKMKVRELSKKEKTQAEEFAKKPKAEALETKPAEEKTEKK